MTGATPTSSWSRTRTANSTPRPRPASPPPRRGTRRWLRASPNSRARATNCGAASRWSRTAHRCRPASRPRPRRTWQAGFVPAALAASLVAAIALFAFRGESLRTGDELLALAPAQTFEAGGALHEALERAPSAAAVAAGDATVRPALSFRSTDGRWCREFEVARGAQASLAVACRADGAWTVVAAATGLARTAGAVGGYATASAPESAAVADTVERLMNGDAMSADDESRAIAAGWP